MCLYLCSVKNGPRVSVHVRSTCDVHLGAISGLALRSNSIISICSGYLAKCNYNKSNQWSSSFIGRPCDAGGRGRHAPQSEVCSHCPPKWRGIEPRLSDVSVCSRSTLYPHVRGNWKLHRISRKDLLVEWEYGFISCVA